MINYAELVDSNNQAQSKTLAGADIPAIELERKRLMKEAWKAYSGDFTPPLKIAEGQPNDNVISNRCEPIVSKGVAYLFGKTVKIEAQEETATPNTALQDSITDIWGDEDAMMTTLAQAGINGGVTGMSFLRILPPDDRHEHTRIIPLDSKIIRIVTDPDDVSDVWAFIIEYPCGDGYEKRQVISCIDQQLPLTMSVNPDYLPGWEIHTYFRKGTNGSWFEPGTGDYWAYPFPPIYFCQNLANPNEPWGCSDLPAEMIGLNNSLNFVQSNTSRIIKFHGHPKTWVTGMDADSLNTAVDDLICLPSSDSKIGNLEMIQTLTDQRNFAMDIRGHMDEQSRVPALALGRETSLPRGDISGVALKLILQPIIEKTTMKQRLYGTMVRGVTRAALVVEGVLALEKYKTFKVQLHFQNVMPEDDLQAAQTALLLRQIGVSLETVLNQLGYDPNEEIERLKHELATLSDIIPMLSKSQQGQLMESAPNGKGSVAQGANTGPAPTKKPNPTSDDTGGTK